jgi:hypothetical protein
VSTSIVDLWRAGKLPIRAGLYRADGAAIVARYDPNSPGGLSLLDQFSLEAVMRADPDYVTHIDITVKHELACGGGCLVAGEGSYGSEGFFARIDAANMLIWVVYLEDSNPFVNVTVESTFATFTSSSGLVITIDLEASEFHPNPT